MLCVPPVKQRYPGSFMGSSLYSPSVTRCYSLSFLRYALVGVICFPHSHVMPLTSCPATSLPSPVIPRACYFLPPLRYSPWLPRLPRKLFYDAGIFRDQLAGVVIVQFNFLERPPESGPSDGALKAGNGASWPLLGPTRPRHLVRHEPPCFAMCVQNFTPNFEINFGSHCIILLNLHINQGILIRVHP